MRYHHYALSRKRRPSSDSLKRRQRRRGSRYSNNTRSGTGSFVSQNGSGRAEKGEDSFVHQDKYFRSTGRASRKAQHRASVSECLRAQKRVFAASRLNHEIRGLLAKRLAAMRLLRKRSFLSFLLFSNPEAMTQRLWCCSVAKHRPRDQNAVHSRKFE